MSYKKKDIIGKFIVVIISTIFCLGFAEIILRQIIYLDLAPSVMYRIPHPVYGWVLEAGASYHRNSDRKVRVTYNSRGFRDSEHKVENIDNKFRVLVLGDSYMEAYSVELNEAFHKQLEHLAAQKGIDLEVINMGVGGYGTLQEYLVFHGIGKLYKPNLVLLGFYVANDVGNNSMELTKTLGAGRMKYDSRPFLNLLDSSTWKITKLNYEKMYQQYKINKKKRNSFFNKLKRKSAIAHICIITIQKQIWKIKSKKIKSYSKAEIDHWLEKRKKRYIAQHSINFPQISPEYVRAWHITKQILARLKDDVEAIGAKLFIFTVPSIREVDIIIMEKVIGEAPNSDMVPNLKDPPSYKCLKNMLEELNIKYIDLLPSFRNVRNNNGIKLMEYPSDLHWNSQAHALAAKLVFSDLIKKKLFPLPNTKPQHTIFCNSKNASTIKQR